MEPATPSSVMGDSEASGQLGGAEKNAGITIDIDPEQFRRAALGYTPGVGDELRYAAEHRGLIAHSDTYANDLSDVLLASLYPMPKGYVLQPKNRHERRKNRALLRDGTLLAIGLFGRSPL